MGKGALEEELVDELTPHHQPRAAAAAAAALVVLVCHFVEGRRDLLADGEVGRFLKPAPFRVQRRRRALDVGDDLAEYERRLERIAPRLFELGFESGLGLGFGLGSGPGLGLG